MVLAVLGAAAGNAQGGGGGTTIDRVIDISPAPSFVVEHELADLEALSFVPVQGVRLLLYDIQHDATLPEPATYTRVATQATSYAGLNAIAQHAFSFDPSYQRFEIHHIRIIRDGVAEDRKNLAHLDLLRREELLEQQMLTGAVTATLRFDDVRVGDTLDIAYTLYGVPTAFEGRDSQMFALGFPGFGVERLAVRSRWGADAEWRLGGSGPSVDVTEERGTVLLEVPPQPVAEFEIEDFVPYWEPLLPTLSVANFGDWSDVAGWGRALFEVAADEEVQALARSIAAEHPSEADQVVAALRFVQQEIRYFATVLGEGGYRPTPPSETLASRSGDCKAKTVLFLALLDALGIEAHAAFVNSVAGRAVDKLPPSPSAFDHVIARVVLDGESYWLDPSSVFEGGRLANHSQPDFGWALPLERGTRSLVSMERDAAEAPTTVWRDTVDLSGGAESPARVRIETTYTGVDADIQRALHASYDKADLDELMTSFVTGAYGEGRPIGERVFTDDLDANIFTTSFEVEIDEPFEERAAERRRQFEVTGYIFIDPLPTTEHEGRLWPLAVLGSGRVRQEFVFLLPDVGGWTLASETVEVENDVFRFERSTRLDGLAYTLELEQAIVGRQVAPADIEQVAQDQTEARGHRTQRLWINMPSSLPELSLPPVNLEIVP